MNIGLLHDSSAWGGAEIHALGLAKTLMDRGHSVTLAGLTERAQQVCRERVAGIVPNESLGITRPPRDMGYREWRRLLRGRPWDVCLLIKGDIDTGGGLAFDLAARREFRNYLVLEQKDAPDLGPRRTRRHFGVLPGLGLWWYKAHILRYLRSLGPRKIVCVSDANRRRLIRDFRFPKTKMEAVHNGADVDRFQRDPVWRRVWRERWNAGDGTLVFGAVGRLTPIKGYDIALDAFQILLGRVPDRDCRLVLVGEGPEEDRLRRKADEMGAGGRVVFIPFQEKPEALLSAFDVFVMPSLNEGFPLALAEAMACECCPIATDVGGIGEAVSHSEIGWLVPPGNPGRFADAMMDAGGRGAEELGLMGRRARDRVRENFDATRQFEALVRIIESFGPPGG